MNNDENKPFYEKDKIWLLQLMKVAWFRVIIASVLAFVIIHYVHIIVNDAGPFMSMVLGVTTFVTFGIPFIWTCSSIYFSYMMEYDEEYRTQHNKEMDEYIEEELEREDRIRAHKEWLDNNPHLVQQPTVNVEIPTSVKVVATGYAAKKGFDLGRKIGKSLV